MSRSSPIGQFGMRAPPGRRQASDDQHPTQPVTQPSPHWPPPYSDAAQRGQQQAPGYYFPQSGTGGDAPQGLAPHASAQPSPFNRFQSQQGTDPGRGFGSSAPQASVHQLPFNRFPPQPGTDPNFGYEQQHGEQQPPNFGFPPGAHHPTQPGAAGPDWGQQTDPRFDLGNYMATPGQQGYAPSDAGQFPGQPDPPHSSPRRAMARRMPSTTKPCWRTRRSRGVDAAG